MKNENEKFIRNLRHRKGLLSCELTVYFFSALIISCELVVILWGV